MKTLVRLIPFLRPYWRQVAAALVTTLALTATMLAVPGILQQVIDRGLARGEMTFLVLSALALFGIGALNAALLYLQRYLSEWIAAHIGFDLRNRLYDQIQHLPFTFHDHAQTGQLISRVIEDVRAVERFTGFGVVEMIRLFLLLGIILALLFLDQPRLASIAILPLIPLAILTIRFGRQVGGFFLDVDNTLGELSAVLQENVSGVQVVRAFAREPYEIERFDTQNRRLFRAQLRVVNRFSRIMPTSHWLVSLATILILWFGGQMVLRGEMTIGEVVAFNSYLLMLANPAQQLGWLVNSAGEAVAGLKRSFDILDLQPEIQSPPNPRPIGRLAGRIEFRQVDFQYSGQTSSALKGINLTIEPNQVVALIGPTGSGKTSLVNLIPRFYDPTAGAVLLDGMDVRELDLTALRQQIGIVLQTSLLFSVTIAENIAYGRPEATQAEIEQAARLAQAHDFIMELPQGYQTVVGERGVTLSGGQRQRIAIARALLLNPRILILDDSTSSVDTETELLIQRALETLMEGRTTLIIAHRLSTVRRADLILVLQDGRIVERGRHQELLALGGLYREIYDLQLRDQEQFHEDMEALQLPATMLPEESREGME